MRGRGGKGSAQYDPWLDPRIQQQRRKFLVKRVTVGVVAIFVGGASFFLMKNSMNPPEFLYEPQEALKKQKKLNQLSPKVCQELLLKQDYVQLLASDLSSLRVKILRGDEKEIRSNLVSGRKREGLDGKYETFAIAYGPELLTFMACRPKLTKDQNAFVVIFNPKPEDDHLLQASWRTIIDYYVDRVFPRKEMDDISEAIYAHSANLKSLTICGSQGDNNSSSSVEVRIDAIRKGQNDLESAQKLMENIMGLDAGDITGSVFVDEVAAPCYFVQDSTVDSMKNVVVFPLISLAQT